ncbi:MAG: hypothetical protein COV46_02460 [Deltaproteobacteria bacterium CG11_big_fil_rev_8_21_14_0_20_49_13]|nr:MAG: hypothetical protein COV46_02460 [Deltaproteobacteria bacterium CG11_big_fil_rev_8_21_14_0_20_49_13]
MKDLRNHIKKCIKKQGVIKASELVARFKISRQAMHRYIKEMLSEGLLIKQGSSRATAHYLYNSPLAIKKYRSKNVSFRKRCLLKGLEEDSVFQKMEEQSGLFSSLAVKAKASLRYAFTEMLNNAIDHSGSKFADIVVNVNKRTASFDIRDNGVGMFANIMSKNELNNEMEAVQDILKGKNTTMPERHSGEGIFFTSKVAELFVMESHRKKVTINNRNNDVYVEDRRMLKGTSVHFEISVDSKTEVTNIFKAFTNESFTFDKSRINVRLFDSGEAYMSRSQAKRLLHSLENFKKVVLDFNGIDTIGQAFADEVFRVFKKLHPDIVIEPVNCGENVQFMIGHVNS